MNRSIYAGCFAEQPILFDFRHTDTASYFGNFLSPADDCDKTRSAGTVVVADESFDEWHEAWDMPHNAFTEFSLSIYPATDILLRHGACAFHGAAFLWHKKAWLLSADSGVGKSTQLGNLISLHGDEIKVINGDKPLLKREENGCITVFPSPWKGKENWGDDHLTAPLGGVILLKQGRKNKIKKLQALDCAAWLLSQIFSIYENEGTVHAACRIAEAILDSVPVWQLTNQGDLASSQLVFDTLLTYERGLE